MTREEAIEIIKQDIPCEHDTDLIEALEMVIKAFEREPCEDCISRESVRQLICKNNDRYGYSHRFHEFTEECLQLPPVTPQYTDAEIQKMQEMEQAEIQKAYELGKAEQPEIGHCKDCKHWRDSDGAYRRDIHAESNCPMNCKEVYEGTGYCFLFESKAESEDKGMTREEVLKQLGELKFALSGTDEQFLDIVALEVAIKALEQEPCEDAISRQAVMHILDEVGEDFDTPREAVIPIDYIADMISDLPFVTPQSKTGRWIDDCGGVKCSSCGFCIDDCYYVRTYCPNCGVKMESEVEE